MPMHIQIERIACAKFCTSSYKRKRAQIGCRTAHLLIEDGAPLEKDDPTQHDDCHHEDREHSKYEPPECVRACVCMCVCV
jgi:hypothetical protein